MAKNDTAWQPRSWISTVSRFSRDQMVATCVLLNATYHQNVNLFMFDLQCNSFTLPTEVVKNHLLSKPLLLKNPFNHKHLHCGKSVIWHPRWGNKKKLNYTRVFCHPPASNIFPALPRVLSLCSYFADLSKRSIPHTCFWPLYLTFNPSILESNGDDEWGKQFCTPLSVNLYPVTQTQIQIGLILYYKLKKNTKSWSRETTIYG